MSNFEDFLREEYNSLNSSLIENEQLGERRIQFLISLAGALITAGGLLSFSGIISISEIPNNVDDDKAVNLRLVTFAIVMSFLLLLIIPFGFITLIRVVTRNSYTDYFVWRLNKIRTYYVRTENDENCEYLAFNPYTKPIDECPKPRKLNYNLTNFFGKGGIVPTVILLNTVLVAILFGILSGVIIPNYIFEPYPNVWPAILGFVVGWVGFGLFQMFIHNTLSKKFSLELCGKSQLLREREDVLIICSNIPHKKNKGIFEEIIRWEIPNKSYQLISQNSEDFQDIYFDFNDKFFQEMKVAMRVRKTYNKNIVTIKIPTGEKIKTGRDDIEIEKSCSKDGLIEIFTYVRNLRNESRLKQFFTYVRNLRNKSRLKQLKKFKKFKNKIDQILVRLSDDKFPLTNDIIESIKILDLQVVQDRYTHREIRNAIRKDGKYDEVLAELAIDSVIYNIDGKKIHHYDIEVEEKKRHGALARIAIIESFASSIYNPFLIKWTCGKLVLGKGIEKLIKEGDLPEDEFGNLSIRTYRRVEEMIRDRLI